MMSEVFKIIGSVLFIVFMIPIYAIICEWCVLKKHQIVKRSRKELAEFEEKLWRDSK